MFISMYVMIILWFQ